MHSGLLAVVSITGVAEEEAWNGFDQARLMPEHVQSDKIVSSTFGVKNTKIESLKEA